MHTVAVVILFLSGFSFSATGTRGAQSLAIAFHAADLPAQQLPTPTPTVNTPHILVGVVFGVMLFAAVSTIVLAVSFAQRHYEYFVLFTGCFAVTLLYEYFSLDEYLLRHTQTLALFVRYALPSLTILVGIVFLQRFLDAHFVAKRLDMCLIIVIPIYALVVVFLLAGGVDFWQTRVFPILNAVSTLLLLAIWGIVIKKNAGILGLNSLEIASALGLIVLVPGKAFVLSGLMLFGEPLSAQIIVNTLLCINIALVPVALVLRIRDSNKKLLIALRERSLAEQEALTEHRRNDALRRANTEVLAQQDLLEQQRRQIEAMNAALQENNLQLGAQNLQLKELHHEKDELFGIVAHDLKNPLGAIASFANIIKHDNTTLTVHQRMEFIDHIIESAERMFQIIRNLLDLNALERGGMRVQIQPIEISSLLEYAIGSFEERAAQKNILLHKNLTVPSFVHADENLIMQVVDNLLSNAIKYSPHGKNVVLRTQPHHSEAGHIVRLEIQDQGPGLSEEDKAHLFGKFSRLSAQPTGGEHSTGLGLSIVKKMVEAMNGRVWCESTLGEGATFIVELPSAHDEYEESGRG